MNEQDSSLAAAPARRAGVRRLGPLTVLLQVLATIGYGLWMLLGMSLALGIYSDGRGEVLVPLVLGVVLVGVGLLLASLRLRWAPAWFGWQPGRSIWPGREAMVALLCYLPALAVAGLARGDNDFWATRLSGAALMLCSLTCLVYAAPRPELVGLGGSRLLAAQLPVGRVVSALYGGGLWLWLCVSGQGTDERIGDLHPWILGLLLIALVLGLVEGSRWHALEIPRPLATRRHPSLRLLAAGLTYGVPCLTLLWTELAGEALPLAAVAALCHLLGRWLEQQLYGHALWRQRRRAVTELS